jgi:hypothetical protein
MFGAVALLSPVAAAQFAEKKVRQKQAARLWIRVAAAGQKI